MVVVELGLGYEVIGLGLVVCCDGVGLWWLCWEVWVMG